MYAVDAGFAFCHIGPMDEPNSERIITPMPKSLVKTIDDYRFAQRSPSRAEAIRRLIELGLEAAKQRETAE
jgi:metal-responsive CopG/Arc/MetJ family transcriptional regulator